MTVKGFSVKSKKIFRIDKRLLVCSISSSLNLLSLKEFNVQIINPIGLKFRSIK